MAAAPFRFRSVYEDDLDKAFLSELKTYTEAIWLLPLNGCAWELTSFFDFPLQITRGRDRNVELMIKKLLNMKGVILDYIRKYLNVKMQHSLNIWTWLALTHDFADFSGLCVSQSYLLLDEVF